MSARCKSVSPYVPSKGEYVKMTDERFYKKVSDELKSGDLHEGLWIKCLVEYNGDEHLARIKYFKIRVEQLMTEDAGSDERKRGGRRWQNPCRLKPNSCRHKNQTALKGSQISKGPLLRTQKEGKPMNTNGER